jgi:hypothetical protein
MNNKKKQHYIWKHYLSPWSQGEKIWSYRDGRIFFGTRENIGQQRFFYEVEPLNDFESTMVDSFIKNKHPTSHLVSLSTFEIYNAVANGDKLVRRNGIEEYHEKIEHKAIPILDKIWEEDLSWLDSVQSKIDFAHYLGVQYSRTNRGHNALASNLREAELKFPKYQGMFNSEKLSKVYALLMGDVIGNWVYSSGNISILKNSTELEFITGDQPVFNLDMRGLDKNEDVSKFNLYYPISPNLALLITEQPRLDRALTIDEVNEYNQFIVDCSHEQIYASNKESLLIYQPDANVC